jgi:DNA-binding transcriptional LysR family regulator
MDLTQLRSFIAITRCGSFRGAAEQLHLAQPSLSQQIRRLESELGVRLFDRTRRPIALTDPGRVLLARAADILRAVDQTTAEVKDFEKEFYGRVQVGAMQYLVHLELPDLLATFRERCPNADLHLRIGNTGEVLDMLVDNEVDVALIHGDGLELPDGFSARPLRTEPLVLITALDDRLARRRHVAWRDLSDADFIVFRAGASLHHALMDACSRAGFVPKATLETADIATAVALVSRGLGIALLPQSFAAEERHRVAQVGVGDEPLTRTVVLAWNDDAYQSRALRAFKALATTTFGPAPG